MVTRLRSIKLAGQSILVKMFITLNLQGNILIEFCILIHLNIVKIKVCKTDEALPSISPACHGQLVKILITLGPHGIF